VSIPIRCLSLSDSIRAKTLDRVIAFHTQRGIPTKTRSARQDDRWYDLYCFADPQHAAQFQGEFGGEIINQRKEPQACATARTPYLSSGFTPPRQPTIHARGSGGNPQMNIRIAMLGAACLALSGCASQQSTTALNYVRTDGRTTDTTQAQAVLAQCQGEGARSVGDQVYANGVIPWVTAVSSRSSKENTITNACMARNGYLAQ
jgi:hypothetical protein